MMSKGGSWWARGVAAAVLITAAAFCSLQWVSAALTRGDIYGLPWSENVAAQIEQRGQVYFLVCAVLQVVNGILLVPLFASLQGGAVWIRSWDKGLRFLFGLVTSMLGTAVGTSLLIWISRTWRLG